MTTLGRHGTIGKGWALAGLAFMLVVAAYSSTIPFAGAPDEQTHILPVEYLYRFGHVPRPEIDPATPLVGDLSGLTFDRTTFWYYGLPDLYAFGGYAFALLGARFLPPHEGFLAVRAFDWCLAPLFMYGLFSIGSAFGLRGGLLWTVVLAFCAVPQITFIFTYFNSDALALTLATAALASCVSYMRLGGHGRGAALGVVLGLLSCTKIYFFPALLYLALLMGLDALARRGRALARARFALAPWAVSLLVSVPISVATYRFFGDVFGMVGQYRYREVVLTNHYAESMCYLFCDGRIVDYGNLAWWASLYFKSFFAVLGWMDVFLPEGYYTFFFLPLVVAVLVANAGVAVARWRSAEPSGWERRWPSVNFALFWGMAAAVTLSNLYGSQTLIPQPQGRYLFAVVPFAVIQVASMLGGRASAGSARGAEAG